MYGYQEMATGIDSKSQLDSGLITITNKPHQLMKLTKKASRCSGCSKRFKGNLKPRKCSMCGGVFCQPCTTYRRKISCVSAIPWPDDLFSALHNVCGKCVNVEIIMGSHRDLIGEFRQYRKEKIEADMAKATETLCCSTYTRSKRTTLLKEIDRLMEGFCTNTGFFRSLASEITIPDWQKSANWVDSCKVNQCYQCKKTFAFPNSLKSHCRIGGQVFCAQCVQEDLIIYLEDKDGKPKWGINGKDNGQKGRPAHFETYKICLSCSGDLQTILVENISMSHQKSTFMDSICEVQQSIVRMQTNVDKWLPEYQQEIESVDLGMRSIKEAEIKLARMHLNLSSTLLEIERVYDDHLFMLHQKPESPIKDREKIVLKSALKGIHLCHQEHWHQFCRAKVQLVKHLSKNDLHQVQEKVSQESIVYVYARISKLAADLELYTKQYDNPDGVFLKDAKEIELSIIEELKPFVQTEVEQNFRAMKEKLSGIDISPIVQTLANFDHVKYIIVSQCSTIMHQCSLQLEAETLDLEFVKTKKSLKQAQDRLEMTLMQFNSTSKVIPSHHS